MFFLRKYSKKYLPFCLTLFLTLFCVDQLFSQENPIGVFVETMKINEDTRKIDRCKYCGKFIKAGTIHSDAETIIGNQIGEELDYRNIQYEWGREGDKYLHVYIYRFEERRGGNFAVEKPAGVGFHVHLIEKGNTKNIFVFDEDQHSLSENILDIGKFLRRGGKWITADVLSREGVEKALNALEEELR